VSPSGSGTECIMYTYFRERSEREIFPFMHDKIIQANNALSPDLPSAWGGTPPLDQRLGTAHPQKLG